MDNVIVIFQTTHEHTEGLALALGLGAVQKGANIRLRHLDPSPGVKLAHAGYGTLKADDLRWAEGVAVLLESEHPTGLSLLKESVRAIAHDAGNAGKRSFVYGDEGNSESIRLVRAMLHQAGFQQLADDAAPAASLEYMNHVGNRLAEVKLNE